MNITELCLTLNEVQYKDVEWSIKPVYSFNSKVCLGWTVTMMRQEFDHVSGEKKWMFGREWYVGVETSKSDLVRTCFAAVMAWEEHEIRESFKYKGVSIFEPHFDVDGMLGFARKYNHGEE